MRKKLTQIFTAAIIIFMFACARVETRKPDNSIRFSPVASKSTRAIISGVSYPIDESFTVSAYANGTYAYFEEQTASYSAVKHFWATDEVQYWPLSGSLTFQAYSPSSASGIEVSSSGISADGYTIINTAQMNTDLCYASATVPDCANHPDSVSLTFSHALSQIVIRAKAADYYNDANREVSISVNSLALTGIYSTGDFADGAWTNQDNEFSYTISSSSTALSYDAQHEPETVNLCSCLLIPQELGPNAKLRVGFSIIQTVNSVDHSLENPPAQIAIGSNITEWEPGKKYIYTLSIGMDHSIVFTASAVGWQDENDNIIVEEN